MELLQAGKLWDIPLLLLGSSQDPNCQASRVCPDHQQSLSFHPKAVKDEWNTIIDIQQDSYELQRCIVMLFSTTKKRKQSITPITLHSDNVRLRSYINKT